MLVWIEPSTELGTKPGTEPAASPTEEPRVRTYSLTDWYGQDCFYTDGQDVPTEWLEQFPNAKLLPPVILEHASRFPMFPVKVGMAFVPPAE